MSNHKASGTRKERELMKLLEADGYECTRSGASLGRYDVIALMRGGSRPHSLWIQVKYGTQKYINYCIREWLQNRMPPYHHESLYCCIRGKGWSELIADDGEMRLVKRFSGIIRTRKKEAL